MKKNDKILLKFHIKSYDLFDDSESYLEYKINERFDKNLKFNEVIDYMMIKYIIPSLNNIRNPYCYSLGFTDKLWSVYFNSKNGFSYKKSFDLDLQSLKIQLWKLNNQFNISRKTIDLTICGPGVGGEVGRFYGIKFFFHTNEKDIHHIPHIHCLFSGQEFRVNLNNLTLIDKPFENKAKTKEALHLIKVNKEDLIHYWNKVVINGEYIKFKMVHYD